MKLFVCLLLGVCIIISRAYGQFVFGQEGGGNSDNNKYDQVVEPAQFFKRLYF